MLRFNDPRIDFNVKFRDYDFIVEKLDNEHVFLSFTSLLNAKELSDPDKLEKLCEGFEEWDARICDFIMEPKAFLSCTYDVKYIINTDDKYGFDTNLYLRQLTSNNSKKEGANIAYSSLRRSYFDMKFPRKYHDFENFKMWFFGGRNHMDFKVLIDKIKNSRPVEMPCTVSHCFIEGVIDSFIVRNKKYTLAEAISYLVKVHCEEPPNYEKSFKEHAT